MDEPIRYMQRTRDWYLALGYEHPYRWASFEDVPFTKLPKPLADCTLTLVTTASREGGKFREPYFGSTGEDPALTVTHVAVDRKHARFTDSNAWFPLPLMRSLAREGRFRLAARFHGVPTKYSQRQTQEEDAPRVVQRCREDGVDAALLVPNCPVCHQTLAMTARALEAAGIATVVMGAARDIVEHAGVPRFLFSDFPLGNAAGKPHDPASQRATFELALQLLEQAQSARTTWVNPQRWAASDDWKLDYSNPARATPEQLRDARSAFEALKLSSPAAHKP